MPFELMQILLSILVCTNEIEKSDCCKRRFGKLTDLPKGKKNKKVARKVHRSSVQRLGSTFVDQGMNNLRC